MAINVDDELHNGLVEIMDNHTMEVKKKYQENSSHHLFWNQQVTNLLKFPKHCCWHPMIIRWCLHLPCIQYTVHYEYSWKSRHSENLPEYSLILLNTYYSRNYAVIIDTYA